MDVTRDVRPETTGGVSSAPDCTIVIVHYRAEAHLARCLESLENTPSSLSFETIVVDNSRTLAASGLSQRFPAVTWIENAENVGFARATNEGFRRARGRHLLLLNPDTIVQGDALGALASALEGDATVGAVGARLLNGDGTLQYSCRRFPGYGTIFFGRYSILTRLFPKNAVSRDYLYLDWDHASPRFVDWVSGACLMTRREVVDRIGPLDPGYFLFVEDMDFCRRVQDAGWQVAYVPGAVVTHAIGVSRGPVPPRLVWERHRSMLRYVAKHWRPSWPVYGTIALALGLRAAGLAVANALRRLG